MPFPWYHSELPDWVSDSQVHKGEAQVADRIRTQARILRNLEYTLDEAIQRVRLYLEWEWELPRGQQIPCWDDVEKIVSQTYDMTIKHTERGFPDPDKVRDHIRKTYTSKLPPDSGAC